MNDFDSDPRPNITTLEETATYQLASVFRAIPDPSKGGPRGQMVTFFDSWYPQTESILNELREKGDRGVSYFDWEVRHGFQ